MAEEPPWALREVDRLIRNPEKDGQRRRQVLEGHLRAKEPDRPTGLLTLPGENWSSPGKRDQETFMRMKLNRKVGNDVNGASIQRNRGFASGRGGGYGATQVVNQRKPCTRREGRLFNGKKEICVGTWNVRTLYAPGQLDILLHQLKRHYTDM